MALNRIAVAAALALLAMSCSSSSDPAANRQPSSPPGEATASDGSLTGGGDGSVTPSTSADPTVQGSADASPNTEPRVVAARVRPPVAGTYRYRQEGVSLFGPMPEEGTRTIGAPDDRARQTHTRIVSENETTEQRLRFTDAGVELLAITQTYGSGALAESYDCRFDPPLTVIELPMTVGDRIDASSTCGELTVGYTARILRTENRTIGGRAIETVVMRATITATGPDVSQTTTTTSWLSPVYRLVVRSEQRAEGRYGGVGYHTSLTEELLELRPR